MLHSTATGAGQDLVLIHGWGMNGAVWAGVATELARSHRVTVVDLPGHGHSPFDPRQGTLEGWRDALLAAAPESAVWIGWSLGGSLALAAALAAPQRVRALALVSATPRFVRGPDWEHAMLADTLERFREALTQDPSATLERFLALQTLGGEASREVLRGLRRRLAAAPAADVAALDAGLDLLRDIDLRDGLATLAMSSLWLYGNRDTLVPWQASERIAAWVPQARTVVIRGAAHAPLLSHPQPSLEALRDFLNEVT